jgi:cytosine/uracil/thiamine/allantoin permease
MNRLRAPFTDADRDSTAWQQFWIWFGANIAPLYWLAGAIGPQLGLSLVQSIVIMVAGQVAHAPCVGSGGPGVFRLAVPRIPTRLKTTVPG